MHAKPRFVIGILVMFLKEIRSLKEISAEHLLQNKSQPYAEGVLSALSEYNAFV